MIAKAVRNYGLICLILVFISCGTGVQHSPSGLIYKFIEDVEGELARPGDVLTLSMIYKTDNDTLLFSSKMISDSFRLILKKPTFAGGMEEGLALMSPGDSIVFSVDADSLYAITFENTKPKFVKSGSKVKFYVRLKKITPLEVYEKELDHVKAKNYQYEQARINEYVKQNNITTTPLESGVYFIETKKGSSKQVLYDMLVGVRYTGKFFNGKVFDTNANKKELYYFKVGRGEVILGWDEAVQRMNVGGRATVIVPSLLAYGDVGAGPIRPFTPLLFDIEVVEVK